MSVRLLSEILEEEARRARRGKLKIFFGFAPGVGKTYAMLEAARALQHRGVDVVAGWIQTHGRPETEALTPGFERLPPRVVPGAHGATPELDLDAALTRRPTVLLVDELAHRNPRGLRHERRWQDVLALLSAGIDVYATLNVQHVESLNGVIAEATGVAIEETVPDAILERADEIEVIDLPPDELLQRLHDGKVSVNEQAQRAVVGLFRRGNLLALREMTLRRAADRVDDQLRGYRSTQGIAATWAVGERIAVCVGPGPFSAGLIRAARRMAGGLRAPWYATFVETAAFRDLPEIERDHVDQHLELAASLGGTPVRLQGQRISEEVLRFARQENITQIIVGKPTHPRWRDFVYGSLLDELLRNSGNIGIYAIKGEVVPRAGGSSAPPGPGDAAG
jgi:two-component system sensor histidine kinase KdpD